MRTVVVTLVAILLSGCALRGSDTSRAISIARSGLSVNAEYVPTEGDSAVEGLEQLYQAAAALKVSVREFTEEELAEQAAAFGGPPVGMLFPNQRQIYFSPGMDINAKFEVLAHELAHWMQPAGFSKAEAEVYAELVGLEVQKGLGYPPQVETTGKYLSAYKQALYIAETHKVDIREAARILVGLAKGTLTIEEIQ